MRVPLLILDTNIDDVLNSLAGVEQAVIDAPVAAMDDTRHWADRARDVATQALTAVSPVEYRRFIGDVVDAVRVDRVGTRALELRARPRAVAGVGKGLDLSEQIGKFDPLFKEELQDVILAWVRDAKIKDGRDLNEDGSAKSDEEIAEGLYWMLFHPDETAFGRDLARDSFLNSDNPTGLLAFARKMQDAGLPVEVLSEWMDVMWESWAAMLEVELPVRIREEFQRLRRG